MSYITKDQLNMYLQKVHSQSGELGTNGTTKSRSTLTGPRPPTFGAMASSRKIFQNNNSSTSLVSPMTPTSIQLDHAVKNLSLSSTPTTVSPGSSSPVLESMGETGVEPVMESMGSDNYGPEDPLYRQSPGMANGHSQHFGAMHGQPGYGPGHSQTWSTAGYGMGAHYQQQHPNGYGDHHSIPQQFYHNSQNHNHQQQHSMHLSQEQYLQLQQQQQQQYQQQQEYLRQQHIAHAAAHGYQPSPTPSPHHQSPIASHMQVPASGSPASKTITPRIVPIVDIPKYTVVNPPRAGIENTNDDQEGDWVPDPPPRESPVKSPSRPYTPIESVTPVRSHTPQLDIHMKKPAKPRDSQVRPPTTAENSEEEDDRVPLPPPREFRRKSAASPILSSAASTPSMRSNTNGVFKLNPPSSSTVMATTTSSKKPVTAAPVTMRDNPAKTNAIATDGKESNMSSPKTAPPKTTTSSVISPTGIAATTTAKPNPWTTRKAVGTLNKDPALKRPKPATLRSATPTSRKPLDMGVGSASQSPTPVTTTPEIHLSRELPQTRPETPPSHPAAPMLQMYNQGPAQIDIEHDSKCIAEQEDLQTMIPLAEDTSKEILVEEKPVPVIDTTPTSSANPSRNSSSGSNKSGSGARAKNQTAFTCASCDEPISGMMITAMGKRWHSDHFVCCVCDQNLEHVQFFQRDGLPYCHLDYHEKFSPKCGHCNSAIENECLTALGKSWHPGHFFCRECGDPFDEDGYMVHDDYPYCEKDYLRLFAPKCSGCQGPIQGDFISALKGKWHRDCFGCTVCHIGFDGMSYYVESGKPYCQTHYKTGNRPSGGSESGSGSS